MATSAPTATAPATSLVFPPVSEMLSCGLTQVHWQYVGPAGQLSLNVSNINVAQPAPYTPTVANPVPAAPSVVGRELLEKRQYNGYGGSYLPPVNYNIATGVDPTSGTYTWDEVVVPQGWYQLLGNIQGSVHSTSPSFFVANGTNTNCIYQFAVAPTTPATSSSRPTSTSSHAAASTIVAAVTSGHSHAGAIAGGVIGGIALFAAAFVAFLYLCLRRRSARSELRDVHDTGRPWSMLSFNKLRYGADARSSIQRHHSTLPTLDATQTFVGTDEEFSTIAHEKAIAAALPLAPPVQPTRSRSQRGSTQTNGSLNNAAFSTESPVRRSHSYKAQPIEVIPLERTQTNQSNRPSSSSEPPLSRSATYNAPPPASPLERTPTGGGGGSSTGGPRRKPAPRYDDAAQAEAEAEAERARNPSSQTTPSSSLGTTNGGVSLGDQPTILRHQSSFGAMRPMHVMIPDPPPAARN